ncbi:MAG: InlB B-repeat-containing protein, partial [Clostridia bacterium]|nr:InlB B-repeat-containing protein [Clostridia bacterium]
MKQKLENVMRNKKVMIALMEILIAIGCIVIFYLLMSSNNRAKETTYSYSRVEEVTEYRVIDNYITRVMPLTSYETFKEIAENTLNAASEDVQYTVKVYSDAEKTEEITDGYIASGMVVEAIEKIDEVPAEEAEEQETQNETETGETVEVNEKTEVETEITEEIPVEEPTEESEEINEEQPSEELPEESTGIVYTVSVLGDMTQDGDISIAELTKLIKGVVGLTDWSFTEEEELSADISGDNEINVVDIELCINYIVFGKLDFEEATFTVIFKDYDGREISKKKDYHYGDTIEIPEGPTREADEIYTYEFAGWAPVISEKVTKDEVYVATYKAIEIATEAVYKVEHYKETQEGTYELAETEELVGKIGEEVTATAKEYTGYRENVESEDRIVAGTVLEDGSLVLKLYYDRNTYTVTFKDEDGTILDTKTYKYEERVELPENPSKEEDNTYTYEFSGWTPEVEETATGDAEYTATYEGTYKEYTVVFKNEDGSVVSSTVYRYGDTVEIPENPTKAEDNTYRYEFAGWTPEVQETVTGDAEYIATYEGIYKEYEVVFKNEDGTELSKKAYHYGETIEIPENPSKAEDNTYRYEFAGWTPVVKDIVTENAEYTATYKIIYREYTVEFKNDDGSLITSKVYHYGDTVEVPENPSKAEDNTYTYEFAGWSPEVKEIVTENAEYIATYTNIYKEYTIVFKNDDGTELSKKIYHYGDRVELPENPTKAADETYTYEFAGWTPEVEETVKGNAEYIATYKNTNIEYTIIFKNYDGTELSRKTYHYGDTVEIPENPTKAEDEIYTYEFDGWTPEVEETVKGDAEYTATFRNIYKEYTIVFKNDDGTELSSKVYHYGDTVEIPENPTKAADETYTYEFAGWTPEVEETVKGDAEYTATYTNTNIEYTIVFKNYDGTELSSNTYHYGDTVEIPENPKKAEDETYTYEFEGWTP